MAQINNTLREIAVREIARMRATLAGCDGQAAEQVAHYAVTTYAREGSAYRALERAKVYARQRARQHVEGVEVDESPAVDEITLWTDPHVDADWGRPRRLSTWPNARATKSSRGTRSPTSRA